MRKHALEVAARTALMALLIVAVMLVGAAPAAPFVPQNDAAALMVVLLSARNAPIAFDDLPRGDQTIVRALLWAQKPDVPGRLGLAEIAGARRGGETWIAVFRSIKSRRLLAADTLGDVTRAFSAADRNDAARDKHVMRENEGERR